MFRIDHPTAVAVKPAPGAAGTPGFFTEGDPVGGIAPTVVTQAWCNSVQEELMSILTAAGIAPDKAATNQVLLALQALGLKVATTAEAQALVNDATIITPKKLADAFKGSNQSLGANGYQKYPGGLIVQWGTTTATASTGDVSTPFPIAFSSALRTLLVSPGITSSMNAATFGSLSLASFGYSIWGAAGTRVAGSTGYFIAIGV